MLILRTHARRTAACQARGGWIQIGLAILAGVLSRIAAKMLAKKDSPIRNDKPTTLTIRGSFISWFVGIRDIGPVFAWAGDREIRKEAGEGGGKGGPSTPEVDVTYEAGWHQLAIGPLTAIHQIRQGGRVIMNGKITNESHPSGSTVDLGKEGSFVVFWGETDQPINTFLGAANRVTVSSRWPNIAYIVWNKKRLTGETWPLINYVCERRPINTLLTNSQGWYEPGEALTGPIYNVVGSLSDADEDVGYLEFNKDRTNKFQATAMIELTGNGLANGTYEVLRSETVIVEIGGGAFPDLVVFTRVFLQGGTSGANSSGSAQLYVKDDTDGANIAHVVAELLFAPFPQGHNLDPNHLIESWDLQSLEDWGVEAETDGWRAGVLGTEGETVEALLGAMMQDHGVLLPLDTATGDLSFTRVREPSGALVTINSDIFDRLPEIETNQGEQPADRLIFTFSDRAQQFGDMTIAIDEDGQAAFLEHQRARKVALVSTVQFSTAAALSELRSPEELAPGGTFKIQASREARDLLPGQPILITGFGEVLRVISVEIDPSSERVSISVIPDFYGGPKSSFETNPGGGAPVVVDPEQDEQFVWVEVPEQLLGGLNNTQTILIPRIRENDNVSFASLYISRDNVTYTLKGNDTFVQTGGTLDDALSADGPAFVALGPEFTELGPDNASLSADYSADLTSWGLGKQVCIIRSSAGTEICFIQKSTIVGGSTRRLDGLMRARYDTRRLAHPIGAEVYIFQDDAITSIQDGLLEPTEDLYVKTQPGTSGGQVNLSAVGAYGEVLQGKGQVPIKPDFVYVTAPSLASPSFQTGDNITVSWAISSGTVQTGAGGQSAGNAIGAAVIPGTVQIELLTTGDTLQSTISVAATVVDFEITNAALISAFSGEPSAFKVRVTHIANGSLSEVSDSLTITRV